MHVPISVDQKNEKIWAVFYKRTYDSRKYLQPRKMIFKEQN